MSALATRVACGEITDPLLPGVEFSRVLQEALPHMTASEREIIQRTQLHAHALGAELLGEHGLPVPGNDPRKPN
jgi:hypothetical protein